MPRMTYQMANQRRRVKAMRILARTKPDRRAKKRAFRLLADVRKSEQAALRRAFANCRSAMENFGRTVTLLAGRFNEIRMPVLVPSGRLILPSVGGASPDMDLDPGAAG